MKIDVLALDGVFDTGLSTVLDALAMANELAPMAGIDSLRFEVRLVGMRRRVRTSQGLTVPAALDGAGPAPDWLVVPAIGCKMPASLEPALQRADVRDAASWLRERAHQGAQTAAACVGTFVLAESGLLDGRSATTSWWLAPLFRQRYPRVTLEASRMVVRSGPTLTAGAALSHVDLALSLVRSASPELASMTAKYLVVDSGRPSQSAYVIPDHLAHHDALVERFERWARERLADGFSLDDAAHALATSKRTLQRRMAEVLGKTPLSYFQDLRVERAVHLLQTRQHDIERIAAEVGYADGVTLRALLRRRLGRGVREIRLHARGETGTVPPADE
ncbi:GlxA family transcriptional regulator [Caldimonas brevitalea]|uniref:AraC family transcriptional regulator n=1 Tax=Caldimonas brevitalea TaxID=413882 RepID=A0A0G3BDH7_9BURK|nr:helix-turn-helix domain-containing protein [Caldimonas brevitalea]AKJ27347.1 AraC family transcriptional regulator [Caldimonas brevitalea]